MNEYRWVARKQKAIAGVAMGISHAVNKETLTNPTAASDFVRLLIKYGIGKGESIEMEFRSRTVIKAGTGANSKYFAARSVKSMCRISSLVGDPRLIFTAAVNREVTRSKIATTATRPTMLEATP